MENQTGEEDDEEVMRVPEDFEVAASDDLHGGGDHEDEGQGDDDTCEASDGGEGEVDWDLLRVLRPEKRKARRTFTLFSLQLINHLNILYTILYIYYYYINGLQRNINSDFSSNTHLCSSSVALQLSQTYQLLCLT